MKSLGNTIARGTRFRQRHSLATATTLVTVAIFALAGCASTAAPTASTASGDTAAQVTTAQQAVDQLKADPAPVVLSLNPLTRPADLKGKTIFVVPVASVVFSTYVTALQSAVTAVGGSIQLCDGQANPSTIDSCFKQAATAGVAGVITYGIPYQLVPNSYDALTAAKIPTLAEFQGAQGAASGPYLAFDSSAPSTTVAMKASVDYVIADSNGAANVLYVGSSDSDETKSVGTVAHDSVTANCSGCTFTDASIPTNQLSDLGSVVSADLLSNPNINWSLQLDVEAFGAPVVAAIQSAGKTSNVSVGGPSGGLGPVQLVQNGSVKFVSLFSPDLLAWNALDAFLRLSNGEAIPTNYPTVTRIIDHSNVSDIALTSDAAISYQWFGDPTFHAEYLKLWGVN